MTDSKNNIVAKRNIHLIVSVCIIIPTALVYGFDPKLILWNLFNIKVETVNLLSIFRAVMSLYLGISAFLVFGILRPRIWPTATILNVIFMGSLAIGRLLSLLLDGIPSVYFLIGLAVEAILACWGIGNIMTAGKQD